MVFRRRLPLTHGGAKFYVSPSAGLRYLLRPIDRVDPTLLKLVHAFVRSKQVVWDIGANVGLFAFAAAHQAGPGGQVVAFEADTWLVQLLRRSAFVQPHSSAPVRVIPVAVARACDLRVFNVAIRSRAASYLEGYGSSQTGGVAEIQTVMSVSLDWAAERLPLPDCVKIDVEGAEIEVITGALEMLRVRRPIVLCEVASENKRQVTALLRDMGYRLFDGERPLTWARELDVATWTTVALPAE